jgi:hypothetical protein
VDLAPPLQLFTRSGAMFFCDLSGRLAVEVEAVWGAEQGADVCIARGVAMQEDRQCLAREHAGRALLDVGVDAQLHRAWWTVTAEQGREQFPQARGAGGRAHLRRGAASGGARLRHSVARAGCRRCFAFGLSVARGRVVDRRDGRRVDGKRRIVIRILPSRGHGDGLGLRRMRRLGLLGCRLRRWG